MSTVNMDLLHESAVIRCNIQIMYAKLKENDARYFTYVLLLQDGKIYVGSTDNIYTRLYDHFTGAETSANWVKEHGPPIRVIEIVEKSEPNDEYYKFCEFASKFGFDNVRGGPYCRVVLREPTCVKTFVHSTRPFKYLSRDDINSIVSRVKFLIQRTSSNATGRQQEQLITQTDE
jgi:hypothetical protein